MDQQLTVKQVATILQVEISTVRFWEKEFSEFLDQPNYKGQRKRFSQKNLETLAQIKELLQTEQYTIKGAKRRMEMDQTLNGALGIDNNFKTTVFFMFISLLKEMQFYRQEGRELKNTIELLRRENNLMQGKLIEAQNKSLVRFFKDKWHNKSS